MPQAPTPLCEDGGLGWDLLQVPKTLPLSPVTDKRGQQVVPEERLLWEARKLNCLESQGFQIQLFNLIQIFEKKITQPFSFTNNWIYLAQLKVDGGRIS